MSLETSLATTISEHPPVTGVSNVAGPGLWQPDKGRVLVENLNIEFGHKGQKRQAVVDAQLDVKPGEFVCLLGPSGCGKSTILNAVAGFVQPTSGRIEVDGVEVTKPGPDRGMVFQQHSLFPWLTVKNNVAFGPLMAGYGQTLAETRARIFLSLVGLTAFEDHYPSMLSGGMQQRVGIARALANYPAVLLMDEPFGALDAQTRSMMQEMLLKLWGSFQNTVLFVTHDVEEAIFLADRVIVMSASPGRIIADIKVPLARPRVPDILTSPELLEIKKHCLSLIRAETLRAFEQQNSAA
ncbi:MAG: ABC transporter ATP-binding protein [Methylovirgula sp.]